MMNNTDLSKNLDKIDLGKEIEESTAPIGCPKCKGTGVIRYIENGYDMGKKCSCYTDYQLSLRQKNSNIPAKYQFAKLNIDSNYILYQFIPTGYDYSTDNKKFIFTYGDKPYNVNAIGKRYIERSISFLNTTPRKDSLSLLICGKAGSGKTNVACAIANEFLRKGLKAYYIKASDYVSKVIQDGFKDDSKKVIRDFLNCSNQNEDENCHLLILDELGEESSKSTDNNFASQEIRNLLKSRTEKLYPTIITTNFIPDELPLYYKEDTISMLCEDFMFFGLVGDSDYRLGLNAKLNDKLGLDDF